MFSDTDNGVCTDGNYLSMTDDHILSVAEISQDISSSSCAPFESETIKQRRSSGLRMRETPRGMRDIYIRN